MKLFIYSTTQQHRYKLLCNKKKSSGMKTKQKKKKAESRDNEHIRRTEIHGHLTRIYSTLFLPNPDLYLDPHETVLTDTSHSNTPEFFHEDRCFTPWEIKQNVKKNSLYLTMLEKVSKNPWSCPSYLQQLTGSVLDWDPCPSKFRGNPFCSSCVTLPTNKPTDQHTQVKT